MVEVGTGPASSSSGPVPAHTIHQEVEFENFDEIDAVGEDDIKFLDPAAYEEGDAGLDDYDRLLVETRTANRTIGGAGSTVNRTALAGSAGGSAVGIDTTVVEPSAADRPPLTEDFMRNYFTKNNLLKSLETFNQEWFEVRGAEGSMSDDQMPDLYVKAQSMADEISFLRQELSAARGVTGESKEQFDKFRKERDFHRMHHRRVVQERRKLLTDFERLKKHYEQFEPTLSELRHKYEIAMKEKMLMRLERDRCLAKFELLSEQVEIEKKNKAAAEDGGVSPVAAKDEDRPRNTKPRDTPWPDMSVENPWNATKGEVEPLKVGEMKNMKTFSKLHQGAISRIAMHPTIAVMATASDDHTWALWSLPNGEIVLKGEGHRDWVSGVSFHSKGQLVATTSGDTTVKLWDMVKETCRHTFTDHTQATWGAEFHEYADFFVSCSMDHTARIFDTNALKCRQTLRGHVDSVNYVGFQPYGTNVVTASGDKTVSLWDLRTGLCVQTFYGHSNAVNYCTFQKSGDVMVSCDADGMCKLWDARMVCEFLQIDAGPHPANSACFDKSGQNLAIGSGDSTVKLFDLEQKIFAKSLEGHEDSVQDVVFSNDNKYLVSAGSDASIKIWQ